MPTRKLAETLHAVMVASLTLVGACASTRDTEFDSALPASRIDAIEAAVREWRATGEPMSAETRLGIVNSLRSDDELVRFMAIAALTEVTGDARGYRWDAPEAIRTERVEAWVPWIRDPGAPAPSPAAVREVEAP